MLAGSGVESAPLICVGGAQQQALDVTTAVQVGWMPGGPACGVRAVEVLHQG